MGVRAIIVGMCALLLSASQDAWAQSVTKSQDPNRRCLECHGQRHIGEIGPDERVTMVGKRVPGESGDPGVPDTPTQQETGSGQAGVLNRPASVRPGLYISPDCTIAGVHAGLLCVECHQDAARLPHAPSLNRATCATSCHAKEAGEFAASSHGAALALGKPNGPTCTSCHGGHEIRAVKDDKPPLHRLRAVQACAECHATHAADEKGVAGEARMSAYLASVHGRAIKGSGLVWAATCVDCHGAHGVRPSSDPASLVHRKNVASTCGQCHTGVEATFNTSVHAIKHEQSRGKAAVCTDCHSGHAITRAGDSPLFVRDVIEECGQCHNAPNANGHAGSYYKTYHESYHGQVTKLGGRRAARCSDCHGHHDIQPTSDPRSRVHPANLVQTCGQCHPGASAQFVKCDPHANHRDRKNYPLLHAVWLYFMVMMSAVFTFFGVHTVLWFVRSTAERRRLNGRAAHEQSKSAIRRFTKLDRVNHALVAITFFGLTATGIPLVFAGQAWAGWLAGMFGGIEAAGIWHRVFAVLLIFNLLLHAWGVMLAFRRRRCSGRQWWLGPNSLLPRWKDVQDCAGMFRWFCGRGPRPSFDRWTYWEKFDYWAEVGGSCIIGGSGLLLWFPVVASKILPGWVFNVAMVVHGYEALLAIGFIFTIHFFNAHVRPGVFPVDEAIFNGCVPEHELKEQRPAEYERLLKSGAIEALRVPAPKRRRRHLVIAVAAVGLGIGLLGLIVIGGVFSA